MQTVTAKITLDLDVDIDPTELQTIEDLFREFMERMAAGPLENFGVEDYDVEIEYS